MSLRTVWKLPVASTALLEGGANLDRRLGRDVGISFSYEGDDDRDHVVALVFEGVEAFRVTYLSAREPSMLEAYDELVDCGSTEWLESAKVRVSEWGKGMKAGRHQAPDDLFRRRPVLRGPLQVLPYRG
jgi:hypothetical protein